VSQVLVGYDHSVESIRAKAELDASYRDLVLGNGCRWPVVDSRVVLQTARYMCGCRPSTHLEDDGIQEILAERRDRAG
jgi:hypothetical protein